MIAFALDVCPRPVPAMASAGTRAQLAGSRPETRDTESRAAEDPMSLEGQSYSPGPAWDAAAEAQRAGRQAAPTRVPPAAAVAARAQGSATPGPPAAPNVAQWYQLDEGACPGCTHTHI